MTSGDSSQTRAEMRAAGVELRQVSKVFEGGVAAVERMNLTIAAGEFLAILGPSGCGKSTLLRLIARLEKPTAGELVMRYPQTDKGLGQAPIAYVFQDAHLLPWRSVLKNVALPLELMGVAASEREARALRALEDVGLGDAVQRKPAQLSGGMRMRVSLARALVTQPALLLLDEPFAALDEITRQQLDEQLHQLWLEHGMTVVFVTHSTAEATFLAQRAVVMSARPARMVLDQRLELPRQRSAELRTDTRFVAQMRDVYEALRKGEA